MTGGLRLCGAAATQASLFPEPVGGTWRVAPFGARVLGVFWSMDRPARPPGETSTGRALPPCPKTEARKRATAGLATSLSPSPAQARADREKPGPAGVLLRPHSLTRVPRSLRNTFGVPLGASTTDDRPPASPLAPPRRAWVEASFSWRGYASARVSWRRDPKAARCQVENKTSIHEIKRTRT